MSWANGLWPGTCTMLADGEFPNGENGFAFLPIYTGCQPETFCLMLNFSECPREEMPSKLSDILEEETDEKYNLSQKACSGILKRADKRGKELPAILRAALEKQAGTISNGNT